MTKCSTSQQPVLDTPSMVRSGFNSGTPELNFEKFIYSTWLSVYRHPIISFNSLLFVHWLAMAIYLFNR